MSKYSVGIEGAEEVWPPVLFSSLAESFAYALRLAKSWEGVSGSPRISINGVEGVPPFWTVDEVLLFEKVRKKALGQK